MLSVMYTRCMQRKPRIDQPGLLYHVIARGIERRQLFSDDADRDFFLTRLGRLAIETRVRVYAFALIPNHFHLVVRRNATRLRRPGTRRRFNGRKVRYLEK